MKFKLILAAAVALTIAACGPQAEAPAPETPAAPQTPAIAPAATTPALVAGTITIEDAWCRPTPNGAKAGGCYVIVTSTADDTLKGVASDLADMTQIHEMKHEDGMMKMSHLDRGLALPAGQRTELKPHGNHIMLMGLKAPLVAGQTAPITLQFDQAEDVQVEFDIRTPPVISSEQ